MSRRDFLVRTAAGTGAAALVGFGASEARAMGVVPAQWDQEADVVVVGFGGAGACAAIEAADAGAKVLILEKQPKSKLLLNTRMSGGIFHCPDPEGDKAGPEGIRQGHVQRREHPGQTRRGAARRVRWAGRGMGRVCPANVDFLKKLDPDFKTVALSGFSGAAFPNFPGAKETKYTVFGSSFTDKAPVSPSRPNVSPRSQKMNGEAFFAGSA